MAKEMNMQYEKTSYAGDVQILKREPYEAIPLTLDFSAVTDKDTSNSASQAQKSAQTASQKANEVAQASGKIDTAVSQANAATKAANEAAQKAEQQAGLVEQKANGRGITFSVTSAGLLNVSKED